MGALDKLKRDLGKHRSKAAILGVLFVTMVVMSVRAVLELQPKPATASGALPGPPLTFAPTGNEAASAADAQKKMEDSARLWAALRRVDPKAAEPSATFTFDAVYYPAPAVVIDPNPPSVAGPALPDVRPVPPQPVVDEAAIKASRIREQGRALVVKSTAVGNGTTEPMAIVNNQLVNVGQKILGFEVTAIRSREVEFVKEGVTIVGKMPDGQ